MQTAIQSVIGTKEYPPTDEQLAFIETVHEQFYADRDGRVIVLSPAVAGAGKTATCLDIYNVLVQNLRYQYIQFVAFGVDAKKELIKRGVNPKHAKTLNGLGYANLRYFAKKRGLKLVIDQEKGVDKLAHCLRQADAELYKFAPIRRFAKALMGFCKAECKKRFDRDTLEALANHYEVFVDVTEEELMDLDTTLEELTVQGFQLCQKAMEINNRIPESGEWLIDFTDQVYLTVLHKIRCFQNDMLLVDEAQDLSVADKFLIDRCLKPNGLLVMVGDDYQCVGADTLIETPEGKKAVYKLQEGDLVKCLYRKQVSFKRVNHITKSCQIYGVKITTESGKTLSMTKDHTLWAAGGESDYVVYLMYRKNLGFRVGTTSKWGVGKGQLGQRPMHEGASKLWVLDSVKSQEEALGLEEQYSLKYGITRYSWVVGDTVRHEYIKDFRHHGLKLLEDKGYQFERPHWFAGGSKVRNVVNLISSSKDGASVCLEFCDEETLQAVRCLGLKTDGRRVRKSFRRYEEAEKFARELASALRIDLKEYIKDDHQYLLVPASQILVGSRILVEGGSELVTEVSEEINNYYDLEVDAANNFYGNGILTHNCIYAWRGCHVNNLQRTLDNPKLNVVHTPLTYNFRSGEEIIAEAQQDCPHIQCGTGRKAVVETVDLKDFDVTELTGDVAVLSRTRAPLVGYAIDCLKAGTPFTFRYSLKWLADMVSSIAGGNHDLQIRSFKSRLEAYVAEKTRLYEENDAEQAIEELNDTVAILETIIEKNMITTNSVHDLIKVIADLDSEINKSDGALRLSTIHGSKGLEWDTTYVIGFADIGKNCYKDWKQVEARNLRLVARTRAKNHLVYLSEIAS